MQYQLKYFDPRRNGTTDDGEGRFTLKFEHNGEKDVYVFAPRVTLAVNVAMATGRPLLVRGEPGSGKSRLAAAVAHRLRWQFYAHTVTSSTKASDLLWAFDALGRFNDASASQETLKPTQSYVAPGPIWWAFDPESAGRRGLDALPAGEKELKNPALSTEQDAALVLIDEIDKADPDVPNDLLEPFDVRAFTVRETNQRIVARRDLVLMLTTNGERELPPAFLRRCILLLLDEPDQKWFELVARQHFPQGKARLQERIAKVVMSLRDEAQARQIRKPSTAEFLDALRVCDRLRIDERSPEWKHVVASVLLKSERPQPREVSGSQHVGA